MLGYFRLILVCSLIGSLQSTEQNWTPEFLSQTRKVNCIPGKIERDVTFLHGTESGDFKKLGKVADMDVCVLLCCEMEKCEAAFMANRNCFAVQCHSREHCVTAPAHKNKWHPSVVFVKKISQSQNSKKSNATKDTNLQSNGNRNSGQEDFKHAQIPQTPSTYAAEVGDAIRITSKTKTETIKMEASDRKPVIRLEKQKMWRKEKMRKSRESLVSAAVVTCSMAFLLSFAAVIAAKIRKQKEMIENPEYSTVPDKEQSEAQ